MKLKKLLPAIGLLGLGATGFGAPLAAMGGAALGEAALGGAALGELGGAALGEAALPGLLDAATLPPLLPMEAATLPYIEGAGGSVGSWEPMSELGRQGALKPYGIDSLLAQAGDKLGSAKMGDALHAMSFASGQQQPQQQFMPQPTAAPYQPTPLAMTPEQKKRYLSMAGFLNG